MSQYAPKRPAAAAKPAVKATAAKPAAAKSTAARPVQRSGDDELRRAVRERLTRVGDSITSRIRVTVNAGVVVLEGVVGNSYERKLIAQAVGQLNSIKSLDLRLKTQAEAGVANKAKDEDDSRNYLPIAIGVAAVALVSVGGWWFWPRPEVVKRPKMAFPTADAKVAEHADMRLRKGEEKNALLPEPGELPEHPVAVRVTFDGKSPVGAFVALHPEAADASVTARPYGYVGKDGEVAWANSKQGEAPPAGNYVVTARWHRPVVVNGESEPGYNILPEKYEKPETSPLRLKVDEAKAIPATLNISR